MSPTFKAKWIVWNKQRYVLALLTFFGFFNIYALRANLSIAVVAMTTAKNTIADNGTTTSSKRDFDWGQETKGYVLSSFFYGYITTQIFGGWLSAKIGGKRVFGGGIIVTALLTLLTPLVANIHVGLLITVRIIEGIFEGVTYPCIYSVWSKWAPPLERTKLASIGFSGSYFGTVVSMPASAYLAGALGWESVFYFFGAVAIVWSGFWWWLVTDLPADNPRISQEELEYIQKTIGDDERKRSVKHPWKKILTSSAVWALVLAHATDNWGFYTLLTQLPTYMDDLGLGLEETGALAALPYLGMAIMMQFSGRIADWLRKNEILTTTQVRKLFSCGAFIIHAAFMLGVAFSTTTLQVMICLVFGVGIGVCAWSGFGVNHLDIAPQHASVIMGLSNTVATIPGICSPILTGHIVRNKTSKEWQIVFFIACGIYVVGSIIYFIYGSGEVQPWAIEAETKTETVPEIKATELDSNEVNEF